MTAKEKLLLKMGAGNEYATWELTPIYYDAGRLLRKMAEEYSKDKFKPPIVRVERKNSKYVYWKKLY